MAAKAFRAALCINNSNVSTPLERLVLGCIGAFASFTLFDFSAYLIELLFPTTVFISFGHLSNNRQSSNFFSKHDSKEKSRKRSGADATRKNATHHTDAAKPRSLFLPRALCLPFLRLFLAAIRQLPWHIGSDTTAARPPRGGRRWCHCDAPFEIRGMLKCKNI